MGDQIMEAPKKETVFQKMTGFRFIVFVITSGIEIYFIHLCRANPDLVQLQGIALGILGMGITLIGGKTITDTYGKK